MWLYLLFAAVVLGCVGLALLWLGRQAYMKTGLPLGEVVYSDTGAWQRLEKPLISRRYGLVGKPDYLVRVSERGRTVTVPVEVKSRNRPPTPIEGHILQLAAYCLLVEEHFHAAPPYGLLRYADATLKIPFTDALRRQTWETADAIRRQRHAANLSRSHTEAQRCRHCGYLHACGVEALPVQGDP
ncbi:MAG: Dna2/Cas4 domain-containing protein [Caldilineaceae bacterium]|nr:Dna2/Cas4 domain-containing protein [Caldilineaceae bacterium]